MFKPRTPLLLRFTRKMKKCQFAITPLADISRYYQIGGQKISSMYVNTKYFREVASQVLTTTRQFRN